MRITLHGHSRATMSFNQARNSANVSYPYGYTMWLFDFSETEDTTAYSELSGHSIDIRSGTWEADGPECSTAP